VREAESDRRERLREHQELDLLRHQLFHGRPHDDPAAAAAFDKVPVASASVSVSLPLIFMSKIS
jgi:hypothetical protein